MSARLLDDKTWFCDDCDMGEACSTEQEAFANGRRHDDLVHSVAPLLDDEPTQKIASTTPAWAKRCRRCGDAAAYCLCRRGNAFLGPPSAGIKIGVGDMERAMRDLQRKLK